MKACMENTVKTKLYRMTWYTASCGKTAMSLLFIRVILYGQKFIMCCDGLQPCLDGGHDYGFASSVGHLRLNSVGLLVDGH
jgi:hypothetical protein